MPLNISVFTIVLLTSQISQLLASEQCFNTVNVCLDNELVTMRVSSDYTTCEIGQNVSRAKIRDDYIYAQGLGYYKYHEINKSWNEARKTCMAEGADLVVINSAEENQFVKNLLIKHRNPTLVWIGGHNFFDNEWTTVHGKLLHESGFIDWSKGCGKAPAQPDNHNNNEHCLSIIHNSCESGMNDFPCGNNVHFVCELRETCA